jgi:cytochrome c-type biogenesis protein CcmH/NrfG
VTLVPSATTAVDRRATPSEARAKGGSSASRLAQANDALVEGRVSEACALGESAAAQTPQSPTVWKFLGRCFMRLGERERGMASYRRYLELSPSSPDAVFVREMLK